MNGTSLAIAQVAASVAAAVADNDHSTKPTCYRFSQVQSVHSSPPVNSSIPKVLQVPPEINSANIGMVSYSSSNCIKAHPLNPWYLTDGIPKFSKESSKRKTNDGLLLLPSAVVSEACLSVSTVTEQVLFEDRLRSALQSAKRRRQVGEKENLTDKLADVISEEHRSGESPHFSAGSLSTIHNELLRGVEIGNKEKEQVVLEQEKGQLDSDAVEQVCTSDCGDSKSMVEKTAELEVELVVKDVLQLNGPSDLTALSTTSSSSSASLTSDYVSAKELMPTSDATDLSRSADSTMDHSSSTRLVSTVDAPSNETAQLVIDVKSERERADKLRKMLLEAIIF